MNIEIANRLVQLRKQYGYSQEELASKIGLSRQVVSKWERAESSPDTDNLILLARLYGVSLDELMQTDDEIPEPREEPANNRTNFTITMNGRNVKPESRDSKGKVHIDVEIDKGKRRIDIDAVLVLLVLIAFVVMGFVWNLWHPGWIVFLFIPILELVIKWIIDGERTVRAFFKAFPFAVLVVAAYLLMGFVWNLWHPGWTIFLAIPLYYVIVN